MNGIGVILGIVILTFTGVLFGILLAIGWS